MEYWLEAVQNRRRTKSSVNQLFREQTVTGRRSRVQGNCECCQSWLFHDGVLYYESADTPGRRRLVVPAHLREAILHEAHDPVYSGHFSAKKLIQKLSLMYHWPGMRGDTHKKSTACVTCASRKADQATITQYSSGWTFLLY